MNINERLQRLREQMLEDNDEQPQCTCSYSSSIYDFVLPEHSEDCPLYQPPQEEQQS